MSDVVWDHGFNELPKHEGKVIEARRFETYAGLPSAFCDTCKKPARFISNDNKIALCEDCFSNGYKSADDAEITTQTRKWQKYFDDEPAIESSRVDFSSWKYDPEISTIWCDGPESYLAIQQKVAGR